MALFVPKSLLQRDPSASPSLEGTKESQAERAGIVE
jgi:hypothetical protein